MILCDPAAERAVLSGIFQYGDDSYLEVCDLLKESTFTIDSNQYIYKCLAHVLSVGKTEHTDTISTKKLDIASIYSAAQELGISHLLQKKEEVQHLQAIRDFPVEKSNVKKFAAKIKKLEIARDLYKSLGDTQEKLLDITGTESISSILSIAEDTILDFSTGLVDNATEPESISKNLDDYINNLIDNPISQMGIPTGFPVYDMAIGGGLRKSTINVIAARPKVGKTLLSDNIGFHIANKLKIPVLNMDTEMTKEDHIHRLIAMSAEVEMSKIETGKFAETPAMKEKVLKAVEDLKQTPIFHKSIAGKPFDEQISMMKRWLIKEVGLNDDGTAKDCVIFYDYLKLMDSAGISQDMKEYQVLGFMMTALHNFACKYKLPIVAFVQLNRDGISKESTDTASGSDRIIWLCSNFTIFKRKSDEEIAEDGPEAGNRKLIPVISRHGGGLDDNDYINCHMKGWCAKISEGQTRIELKNNLGIKTNGFTIDENKDQIDFV
jgi:replicative DNA helicase